MIMHDNGFLRFEVKLVNADGSINILEHEATPHRCIILERRHGKLKKLGDKSELKFRVSKIL